MSAVGTDPAALLNAGREDPQASPAGRKDGLRRKTARGAMAALTGQGANFVLRTGSMMVLARLISPEHFGLVNMVAAFTGFLNLFRDAGLAQATVQRKDISPGQTSTLFWINLLVGFVLAGLCAIVAPVVAWFYGEERLVWIMIALGGAFIFNGASAQHRALLQREMMLERLMAIEIVSLVLCIGASMCIALAGLGYWALVAMAAGVPFFSMLGVWMSAHWSPGMPRRGTGVRSMLHYGSMVTLNGLVMYVANNLDKVLLGRFWGAGVLGLYGRAYQLISLPGENLNTVIGWVMFPALSRVQNDPPRLRNYFLKGYGLFLALVAPITIACGVFAADIVRVMLGAQWGEAVPIFSLLAPTIIAAAVLSPLGCLMQATGRVTRSVKISLLMAPVMVLSYTLGLSGGPTGVAIGFSGAMVMLIVPVAAWARHGTLITGRDMLVAAARPVVSAVIAAVLAYGVGRLLGDWGAFSRLVVVSTALFALHAAMLLLVFRQWPEFLDMWRAAGVGRGK